MKWRLFKIRRAQLAELKAMARYWDISVSKLLRVALDKFILEEKSRENDQMDR